jgi:hypothetical protein
LPRRVVVVAAVLLATGVVLSGRGAGASVPSAPRRAAGFDGRVRVAVAVAVGGTIYLGGAFTRVGGAARGRLAAVTAGGGGAVTAWNHRADGRVRTLAASSSRLYAGGQFGAVDGAARSRLAAFSLASGALDAGWRPAADGPVHALRVGLSGTRVYVAGLFTRLGGDPARAYLGAVDAAGGAVDPRFAARVGFPVHAVTTTATSVYGAGDGLGGQLGAWTTAGAAKFPTLQTDGGGQAIAVIGPRSTWAATSATSAPPAPALTVPAARSAPAPGPAGASCSASTRPAAARPPGTRRPTAPWGCSPWPRRPPAAWPPGATSPRSAGPPPAGWPCSAEDHPPATVIGGSRRRPTPAPSPPCTRTSRAGPRPSGRGPAAPSARRSAGTPSTPAGSC